MASLKNGKNRDNCSGDVTHGQSIGKQISYRPYKRIASFSGCFLKEYFLDLEIYLTMRIFVMRKVGSKYNLIELDKVNTKFVHGQG